MLDRDVAIKEYLPTDYAVRTEDHSVRPRSSGTSKDYTWGLERFLDQARMMARLDHPSIVGVHAYVVLNGTGYIVMEYIEGEPLDDRLKRQGKLDPFDFRFRLTAILKRLVGGLEQVHSEGYLHRDITPRNIMLKDDGTPVLIDFGSARQMVAARSRSVTAVVTPGYAPLEQYSTHGKQGPWTDIYALSAVAYRCITGNAPIDATERVQGDALASGSEVGRWGYPDGLLIAIDLGLSLKREERPQDLKAWRHVWCKPSADATEWYRRAAEQGHGRAQFYLGVMCLEGRGIRGVSDSDDEEDATRSHAEWEHDTEEASRWFRLAAEHGVTSAKWYMGDMEEAPAMNNFDNALMWRREAALEGDPAAQYTLGVKYEEGRWGCAGKKFTVEDPDYFSEVDWYRMAAENAALRRLPVRSSDSAWLFDVIDVMYAEGRWEQEDDDQYGLQSYWMAKEQGYSLVQYELGVMYEEGSHEFAQDDEKAVEWYRRAAEQGNADAQHALGHICEAGESVQQQSLFTTLRYLEAAEWYQKAADQGNADAQYALADMYEAGRGVGQDGAFGSPVVSKGGGQRG